ncbi:metal-dependent transcriptional regulator [Glutamicibacter sp. M10]|uniref:metal-dependent transcriptional regulator n=1 Tax=Glutamicibacter sp. M10 TaxID=3023076 RepID=UPI0021C8EC99|nr:metal-dependent transcriptional regulator [Glutamicibacter sp. M10]UXN32967.1 metal-dependent transcriptional regulator [Glutamicibacter sp. M10]
MSVNQLSDSAQNYLKIIFGLTEWSSDPVTASVIAAKAGMKLSTVSGALSKLRQQGLLNHTPYGAVTLTNLGRGYAMAMVRRHRLVETFLVQMLGYRWDQVHDEAENLEHAVSDFMIKRIDDLLDHPTRDPHGDPIPTAEGHISIPEAINLSDAADGSRVVVERIADDDSQLLQYFSDQDIRVGVQLSVSVAEDFSDTITVKVAGKNQPLSSEPVQAPQFGSPT